VTLAPAREYSHVTEAPGNRVTREAIEMLLTRYHWAADVSEGRDVLEVACGAGQGLGYVARRARRVVGGDYTEALLRLAHDQYRDRIPLLRLDAETLPFGDGSFDVIILFEAIYYLPDPPRFLCECRRVLRPGGHLLLCSANCETQDFNPSPLSVRYYTAHELDHLLREQGFATELFGAFPTSGSGHGRLVSTVKRLAVALHLIPETMRGKEMLKRIFLGPLVLFPAEVNETLATAQVPMRLDVAPVACKVVYVRGTRPPNTRA
jgi:ubiquinone/menaquinone biosynthesis C-methylase UbiE